jgi:two-component system, sensor histidine kinase PdtaS
MISSFKRFIEINSFEKVLVYGFYTTFIFVNLLAMIVDFSHQNYTAASIEVFSTTVAIAIFFSTHKTQNLRIGLYGVWIGSVDIYLLIVFSGFAYWNFYFSMLIPLAFYTLFPFRAAFIQTALHFSIIIILLLIGYTNPNNEFIHNIDAMSAFIISMIFMVAFGVFYYANLENSYNKLFKSHREKEILLKEVHHRVKNNLNVLASILGLQALKEEQHTKDILINNKLKIESMSMAHEMLYRHEDYSSISFNQYAKTLFLHICELFDKKDSKIEILSQDVKFPLEMMLKIGLILNEMVTNSLKYAKYQDKLMVKFSCKKDDKFYKFEFSDNGEDAIDIKKITRSKGIGMKLIELITKEFDGTLDISYNHGVKYRFTLKDRGDDA